MNRAVRKAMVFAGLVALAGAMMVLAWRIARKRRLKTTRLDQAA